MAHIKEKEAFGSQDETVASVASDAIQLAEPLRLLRFEGINITNADIFLMFFDATTLPADGTAPKWRHVCPRREQTILDFSTTDDKYHLAGLSFENGLVVAASLTLDTLTVTTDNPVFMQAVVRLRRESALG